MDGKDEGSWPMVELILRKSAQRVRDHVGHVRQAKERDPHIRNRMEPEPARLCSFTAKGHGESGRRYCICSAVLKTWAHCLEFGRAGSGVAATDLCVACVHEITDAERGKPEERSADRIPGHL
eukprot:scaffold157138_cov27-Tisochrysis_lutea.AAC.3